MPVWSLYDSPESITIAVSLKIQDLFFCTMCTRCQCEPRGSWFWLRTQLREQTKSIVGWEPLMLCSSGCNHHTTLFISPSPHPHLDRSIERDYRVKRQGETAHYGLEPWTGRARDAGMDQAWQRGVPLPEHVCGAQLTFPLLPRVHMIPGGPRDG